MQRPATASIAELHELHGFMIEEVHIGDMDSGVLALQFGDGSRAFFEIWLDGYCELTTSHDIINRLSGQRIENIRVRTDTLPDGESNANGDYALYMTIRTSAGGPIITLVWNIFPAAADIVDEDLLHSWLDARPADPVSDAFIREGAKDGTTHPKEESEQPMKNTINVIASVDPALLEPIETLTEAHGFVLGVRNSGYTTTPYAVHICQRAENGRILDHEGEGIEGNYGEAIVAWMPIPFQDSDVQGALLRGKEIRAERARAAQPYLEGDLEEHLLVARTLIFEKSGELGARRTLMKLHAQLGDNAEGPRLPQNAPSDLHTIRAVLTEFAEGAYADDDLLENLCSGVTNHATIR